MTSLFAWLVMRWQIVALAGLVALVGVQQLRVSDAQADAAKAERTLAAHIANQTDLARLAEAAARAEEQRTEIAKEKVADEARQQIESARATALAAARAADGLRERLARIVAASRRAASAAQSARGSSGQPAADATGVLAELLQRADQRAGVVAAHADALRIAAVACEKTYDQLTTRPEGSTP